MRRLLLLMACLVSACSGIPDGVRVVDDFLLPRYLGKWYEIARLDHRFERGLRDITAEYSLNADGSVTVLNSGYDVEQGRRQVAEGRARFVGREDVGQLEVSFFGPFYGAYNIIELDKTAYRYVMIAGPNRDYLWILSRSPQLDPKIQSELIQKANAYGFATDRLIYDTHTP